MTVIEALQSIEAPNSSLGAPLPHVFADEDRLVVAYLVQMPDPHWDGTNARSVAPTTGGENVAILTVERYKAFQFGPPNDEAISGHRLHKLGLRPYSAFEVLNSSWIDALERANRVHAGHFPELFTGCRHFIFTFHDSTLEFIAEGFSASLHRGSVLTVLVEAAGKA